jgi:prolyl 4-hydroxylase
MMDWSRLAEPQADQYDTEVILRLASGRRTPIDGAPAVFDGHVAIRYACRSLPGFEQLSAQYPDGPADHPNIARAVEYVRSWPAAFAQCQRLLHSIHPAMDPQMPLESSEVYRGSVCQSFEGLFGTVWATIFCPVGLAEAIVRETAHQKLRVLGLPQEIQAHYSDVHVAALDVQMLKAERDSVRREALGSVLQRNLKRIEQSNPGRASKGAPDQAEFIASLNAWTQRTISEARTLLRPSIPRIDTSANTIQTPDREVQILLTVNAPRLVVLGNLLSDEECDALIDYSTPRLERSMIVADAKGTAKVGESRTSRGTMLRRRETELVSTIEARLAAVANWPMDYSEGLQVLRYGPADQYKPHFDWMDPALPGMQKYLAYGGQRLATFVLYLSQVEAGGGTSFPEIGLEVMPRKGGAVFFLNTNSEHVPDELTLHAGSPVIKGVKFVANKWLREGEA